MKNSGVIFSLLLILFIGSTVFLLLNRIGSKTSFTEDKSEIISSEEKKQLVEDIVSDINEEYDDELENTKEKGENKGYDQYFVANGYSGASDNVYYIKDGVLYHLVISTNEIIKIAEGVSKIENGKGTIEVYKGTNFKELEEDNYLTYVN